MLPVKKQCILLLSCQRPERHSETCHQPLGSENIFGVKSFDQLPDKMIKMKSSKIFYMAWTSDCPNKKYLSLSKSTTLTRILTKFHHFIQSLSSIGFWSTTANIVKQSINNIISYWIVWTSKSKLGRIVSPNAF